MRKTFWISSALAVLFTASVLVYMIKSANDDFHRQLDARRAAFDEQLAKQKAKDDEMVRKLWGR